MHWWWPISFQIFSCFGLRFCLIFWTFCQSDQNFVFILSSFIFYVYSKKFKFKWRKLTWLLSNFKGERTPPPPLPSSHTHGTGLHYCYNILWEPLFLIFPTRCSNTYSFTYTFLFFSSLAHVRKHCKPFKLKEFGQEAQNIYVGVNNALVRFVRIVYSIYWEFLTSYWPEMMWQLGLIY